MVDIDASKYALGAVLLQELEFDGGATDEDKKE